MVGLSRFFQGQKLSNVKPLGSLMRLVAVDFSGCDALQDVTPLLGGGYDPPADSMADLLLGFSWLVRVSSSFPDLPSQNRIHSIRRWIENRSN